MCTGTVDADSSSISATSANLTSDEDGNDEEVAASWSPISSDGTVISAMKDYATTCPDDVKIIGDVAISVCEKGVHKTTRARGGDLIFRSRYLILDQLTCSA